MEDKPAQLQSNVYKAFEQFIEAYHEDYLTMTRRITEKTPFVGRLSNLNDVDPLLLLQALFYGYELELSPAEQLQAKIKETQTRIRAKGLLKDDATALTDYLDGLQEAAVIMGV